MTLSRDGRVELTLAKVKLRDAGEYRCVATNVVGKCETSAQVTVVREETSIMADDEAEEMVDVPVEVSKLKKDLP